MFMMKVAAQIHTFYCNTANQDCVIYSEYYIQSLFLWFPSSKFVSK